MTDRASDEDLVELVRSGDLGSLGTLVTRWEQPLFRFVLRLLHREDDAKDVCQETFVRVIERVGRFRRGARFSTWMYQIALNLCRDRERRRRRWRRIVTERPSMDDVERTASAGTDADPLEAVQRRVRSAAVLEALDAIPPEQREVLVLKEFEGLKFREIAEILGCAESTAKSRMYHGLSAVRFQLARRGITEP